MDPQEEYITVSAAARRYGHGAQWWYNRIRDKMLTTYEIPGRYKGGTFLKVSEIEAMLQPRPKTLADEEE